MADANFTANKDIETVLNRIVAYRRMVLGMEYESLFDCATLTDKQKRSNLVTMSTMLDDLCEAVEMEANHE